MTKFETGAAPSANVPADYIDTLLTLAVSGVKSMFHPDSQLFCHRRMLSGGELVNEKLSSRYTMMTMLGLARRAAAGHPVPVNTQAVVTGLLALRDWENNLGDVGLMLWLCSEASPDSLPDLCVALDLRNRLRRFPQVREGKTMELAWFVAGLAHARKLVPGRTQDLADVAMEAYKLLVRNQGPYGTFGHSTGGRSLLGTVRGHIGSFADQVYPIYALSHFGQAFGVQDAIEAACRCGEEICRLQGPQGQWWWHYNTRTGKVFETYPVYSVHQHGMAPMALFALGDATGIDFADSINLGLRWVSGTNEVGKDLAEEDLSLIWRGIYLSSKRKVFGARVRSILGKERLTFTGAGFKVRSECRPYELGWLLYAFAGRRPRSTGIGQAESSATAQTQDRSAASADPGVGGPIAGLVPINTII